MTVGELIELLKEHHPERVVVMSRDAEGNGIGPLSNIDACAYLADTTWSGETGLERLTDEDRAAGFDEDDVLDDADAVPALCLWPVN